LSKPDISANVTLVDGLCTIALKSNVLVKDLYLNFEGVEGFFSDNYFDLLPGTTQQITFKTKEKIKNMPKLTMMSLVDSY
jgi:beta-mannosidase